MSETILSLQNIHKTFGTAEALSGVSLEVERGEFLTLLGPSGCGKTTTLRIIAGLEAPDSGQVLLQGQDVTSWEPNRRNVNTVFQSYALFPHMNVARNIGYGLRLKKTPKPEIARRVEEMLALVQLPGYGGRLPNQLSGGQRQRVALARALAIEPEVLLMDEPFGALDAQTRTQLQTELLKTWEKEQKTCFFITHDVEEAIILAQRVIIMSARPGRIKEVVEINIPYPRTQETKMSKEFLDLKNHIWSQVYQEYLAIRK